MSLYRKEPARSIHVIFSVDDSNYFRCCFFASIFLICLLPRCENNADNRKTNRRAFPGIPSLPLRVKDANRFVMRKIYNFVKYLTLLRSTGISLVYLYNFRIRKWKSISRFCFKAEKYRQKANLKDTNLCGLKTILGKSQSRSRFFI